MRYYTALNFTIIKLPYMPNGSELPNLTGDLFTCSLREGTFFLGGRAAEFWYFFQKKVSALPHVLIKKTPDPPLLGD